MEKGRRGLRTAKLAEEEKKWIIKGRQVDGEWGAKERCSEDEMGMEDAARFLPSALNA